MAKDPKKNKKPVFNFYWIYVAIVIVLIATAINSDKSSSTEIVVSEFKQMAQQGQVDKVTIVNEKYAEIYLKQEYLEAPEHKNKIRQPVFGSSKVGPHYHFEVGLYKEHIIEDLEEWDISYTSRTEESLLQDPFVSLLIMAVIMIAIWMFIMKRVSGGGGPGGQIFNIGKSKAKLFEKGKGTDVSFKDVAGLEGAKEEVQEIVDFLKNPKKYTELGAKIPKGALLVGPPGTGKTLLAKAVAGEAQVPFFSLSGSDFVEMFVGVGASRVRDLFKQAKEKAPSIIFIDEIDAVGRARGKNVNFGSNDERENTLNQLLTEMDGFGMNTGVIILAATNRADVLDRALLRAGRFDRQIYVDMPDLNERREIFKVHLKPIKKAKDLDIDFLAKQTPGFSGADIANICNEAALIAARKKKKEVEKQDFLDAVDRIVGGLEKKNKIITKEEKKAIAFHEAGHATVSWLVEHASPLVKVTIVPRGRSLGAAWYLPEERSITRTEQMLDEMCSTMGGRAAEKVIFNKISTGALSDLEKATKQAYAMVSIYGLSDKLGNISYYDSSGQRDSFNKPYSEERAKVIDEEVSNMIENQYQRAIKILSENKEKLTQLADLLLEKEVIFKEDLEKIFGKRPWKKEEEAFDKKKAEEKEGEQKNEDETSSQNNSTETPQNNNETSEAENTDNPTSEDNDEPKTNA